ncbi:hypothetical protein [Sphingobacterium ginsenosidimutans]|uniref:DUF4003 domain-containing protein n=2 Tax=Sphingobacterium TaxID=28453 RepID=A0ABP8AER0_9SPHI
MLRKIIDEALSHNRYFFHKTDFFTGELGLSVSMVLFGMINEETSIYERGMLKLQDIINKCKNNQECNDKDIWILVVLLKFLHENDFIEIEENTLTSLIPNRYKCSANKMVRSKYFTCYAYIGFDYLDLHTIWQEMILELSDIILREDNILFIYNCFFAATCFVRSGNEEFGNILVLIKNMTENLSIEQFDFLSIDNLVMLWKITQQDACLSVIKNRMEHMLYAGQSLSSLIRTTYQVSDLYDDDNIIEKVKLMVMTTGNWSLVNGKLSLLFLDKSIYKSSDLQSIGFVFNLFD